MKFGNIMKLLRTGSGLTQLDMSKKLGISQNYLSIIEQNKKIPSLETISGFASALSISKDALVFVASEAPKELGEKDIQDFNRLQQNILSYLLFQTSGALREGVQ